jgi:hypothetical protein
MFSFEPPQARGQLAEGFGGGGRPPTGFVFGG